jgi:hypothetical protein
MQLIKSLSVMALATGAVVAMPAHVQKRQWTGINRWWNRPSPDSFITVTGYAPQPTDWDASPSDDSTPTSTVVAEVTATPTDSGNWTPPQNASPTPTEAPAAPQDTWTAPAAPSPTATQAPSSGGASGGQGDYMSVVSQWRAAGGLPALTQDSTLEGNAMKTSTDSTNGLEHELNPGTMAQVLAPGTLSNFESVYVGGWLCEIPTLPGLNGICSTAAQGWDHSDGETGHAQVCFPHIIPIEAY